MSISDLAILSVGSHPQLELAVDSKKWERFLAAAEEIGRDPSTLLAESIDLCLDTAISLAIHRQRE